MDKYTNIKLLEAFELVEAQRKYAVPLLQARLTDLMSQSKSEQAPLFSMIELMEAFKAGMEYQIKKK